jgi:hypothetical protein
VPEGVPDNVVRTETENGRTLKFASQGFESEAASLNKLTQRYGALRALQPDNRGLWAD